MVEDWDSFGKFIQQPDWAEGRVAVGGIVVALGIMLEIWFSSRSSSAERKIRDWYALRVAELNAQAEQDRLAHVELKSKLRHMHSRILQEDEIKQVLDIVKAFPGLTSHVLIQTEDYDEFSEQFLFGRQLQSIF